MRAVVDRLSADQEARRIGLPLSALRPVLGPDKANAKRTVRSLLRRGDAEWVEDEAGARCLKLNWLVCVSAMLKREPLDDEPDPLEEAREHRREVEAAMDAIRLEEAEKRRVLREAEALWEEPGRSFERRRYPGPNQLRAIAVLVRYAPDPRLGLPGGAVRRIACAGEAGDMANVFRAIRALNHRGTLQRSKDGKRLRLTAWRIPWSWDLAPHLVDPPLNDAQAEAILEGFGEATGVSRKAMTPWLAKIFPERS